VILFLDRDGRILCINPRGVQLSGYSEMELRGANIFERLLLPKDWPAARQMLDDVVNGKAREYEVRWKTTCPRHFELGDARKHPIQFHLHP